MALEDLDDEVCHALLDFVSEGTYPKSESVIGSEFPASALPKELELISAARGRVEAEISSLSRENDFDADGWISQAKQLHADIEQSRLTARQIVAQHEDTRPLLLRVSDAAAKVNVIETEIAFNQAVIQTLEEAQRISELLDTGNAALRNNQIMVAIDTWESVSMAIKDNFSCSDSNIFNILSESAAELYQKIVNSMRQCWEEQFAVDSKKRTLVVSNHSAISLDDTITALVRLDMLSAVTDRFQRELISAIVDPILLSDGTGRSHGVHVGEMGLEIDSGISQASVPEVLDRMASVFGYLQRCLPAVVFKLLSGTFIPTVSSKVISSRLSPAIPTDLNGLEDFEKTLDAITSFVHAVESLGISGQDGLVSWMKQIPRLWLTKRRADSLDQVRKMLAAKQYTMKQVERIEREKVPMENVTFTASDDWDAGWDDDKEEKGINKSAEVDDEDEDISAWGLDDGTDDKAVEDVATPAVEEDKAKDSWAWGDEEEDQHDQLLSDTRESIAESHSGVAGNTSEREVTLREKYTVTGIPDSVFDIIEQQIMDSETISQPTHSQSHVATSGAGLIALPTLILAMFRAVAPSFYTFRLDSGQMYLYNDSLYLADRVRAIAAEKNLAKLNSDVELLEKFGKLCYSKEMQTQRTIATDLLDGAQGFAQCSEQPFLGECERAVSATVDRVRDIYKEWQPILSHSALLQSIGSLLSSVIHKIVIEVEDLGDISEQESRQLVSLCTRVSRLEDLFRPESTSDTETIPMTAVYVQNWLKFQYLINILESSLADIKFLWLEGELRLEFSPEEVVDLVEALFAESDHRRKAIAEIRRISRS